MENKTKVGKEYAPTKHDGEPDYIPQLKELIRKMIKEKELEEETATGNVDGYNTPFAFGKKGGEKAKGKKQASLTGYTVVNEIENTKVPNKSVAKGGKDIPHKAVTGKIVDKTIADVSGMEVATDKPHKEVDKKVKNNKDIAQQVGMEIVKENRWMDIKREDATPQKKFNKGISIINRQLAEVEKFMNWYGKLKNENGVNNTQFWKRTNGNIYNIK